MREMLTIDDLAKYPFLRKASSFVESYGLTFQDLVNDEYYYVVQRAVERVKCGIRGRWAELNVVDPETEILSYPLALAFVYGLRQGWVVRRFANSEQKRCFELLKNEDKDKVAEVGKDGFDWDLEGTELMVSGALFDFSLPVENYLEVAPSFHSPDWKLVNRHVTGGRVYLKQVEAARLLSEALKLKILRKAEEEYIKKFQMPERLLSKLEGLEKLVKEIKIYDEDAAVEIIEEAKPPCIVALLKDLADGKSLSHMARFTVTTFLINTGESVENVLKYFSNVADFDEGKARYQVEHIAGLIGSKTKYVPPKCDVLRSFGLCIGGDAYCKKVRHPLQYYKMRAREIKRKKGWEKGA
ncbi:MAG: DNA primase large subunit PriL [Candidatus Methanomethyliaceae archaeon]|nr:DNA primase large subunit PriL [Candidatus Methanomethyliaceae archaeon]